MKKLSIIIICFLAIFIIVNNVQGESVILNISYSVLSGNPENMIETLRRLAVEKGGYVKYFSNNKIILRIDGDKTSIIRSYITEAGYIADEQIYRKDVAEELLQLKTQLKVKKQLLDNLYSIFNSSKLVQTLDVEREVGKVVMEIEKIKGKIAYYNDKISLSEVIIDINFSGQNSNRKKDIRTQWDWIRNLGIDNLIKNF